MVIAVATLALGVAPPRSHLTPGHIRGACFPVLDLGPGHQALAQQAPAHCPLPKNWGPALVTSDGYVVKPSECPSDPSLPGCAGRRDS
jgi:hypothetical protein